MFYVLSYNKILLQLQLKLAMLQQNGRYHVHDACQSPYICKH